MNKIINLFQRLVTINLRNIIPWVISAPQFDLQRGLTGQGGAEAGNKSGANQIMFDNYPQTQAVSPGIIISTEIQPESSYCNEILKHPRVPVQDTSLQCNAMLCFQQRIYLKNKNLGSCSES